MTLTGNAVFITGGASGIGLALGAALLEMGDEVMIRGRDRDKLERAREAHPGRAVVGCDLTREAIARPAAKRREIGPGISRLVLLIHRLAPALLAPMMRRA